MMGKEDNERILMSCAVGLFGLPDSPATRRAARETLDFMDTVWRLDADSDDQPATAGGSGRNDGIHS
jgi:hypothetical protein